MSQSNITQEVKDFIKEIKGYQFAIRVDSQGRELLQVPNDNPTIPPDFLPIESTISVMLSRKGIDTEHVNYVKASLPKITGKTYNPVKGKLTTANKFLGTVHENTYVPPQFDVQEVTEIQPFLDYMARMFPDTQERHVITQWLAHMFQRPSERPSWHIMVTSTQGTGKSYLFENIIQPLLGYKQTSVVTDTYAPFFDQHSLHLSETQFCLLDDCDTGNTRSIYNKMKAKLTQETAYIRPLYENGYTVPVFTRIWLNSNDTTPFPIPKADRRWFAPKYIEQVEGVSTAEFLKEVDNFLDNRNGLTQIFSYLMTYSLDGFNAKQIHQTETLKEIINMGKSIAAEDAEEFVKSNPVFKFGTLKEHIRTNVEEHRHKAFREHITQNLCRSTNANLDGKGKTRWWILTSMTNDDAKEYLQANPENGELPLLPPEPIPVPVIEDLEQEEAPF